MKRLLSLFLALSMLLALVPISSAAGAQTVIDLSSVTAYKNPGSSCTLMQSDGAVALTDMQVRRYGTKSDNGPLLAIPFTVSESGDYVLEFKTNETGIENKATAAATAVYIAEYEIKANKKFDTIATNTSAPLVGYFDFSKLTAADVYNVLLDENAQEKTPASIFLTAGKKYTMVFYCDGNSLKYNNMTTYGAVADNFTVGSSGGIYVDGSLLVSNYKQNFYLSGIRLTPKDDFKEAVSALAFSADEKRLDVGETTDTSVKMMYSLSGEKEVTDGISYESSDNSIATVDQNGKITALSEGNATITATHAESGFSDSVEISVFDSSLNTPFELDFSNVTAYRNPDSSPSCVLNTENGVFSLSDIHVRRYGVTSEHGPFLAIPFKVAREGDYAIEIATSSETIENKDTAAAPAVYILKGELSANTKFASLPGVTSSTKPVGYIDFSKITAEDTYADVTADGTFAGVLSTTHFEQGSYIAVFAFDGKSLELNNLTAGGEVDLSVYDCDASGVRTIDGNTILSTAYKQHISVSGMRFVPEKDLRDEFRGIKIVPEKNVLDIGEETKLAPFERWSLSGDKKTSESFIYRSSDESIATVSEDGVVTAHNYGNVIITAELQEKGFFAEIEIKVCDMTPIISATLSAPETVGYLRDEVLSLSGMRASELPVDFVSDKNVKIKWHIECDAEHPNGVEERNGRVFGATFGATAKIYAEITLWGETVKTNEIEVAVVETDMRDHIVDFLKLDSNLANTARIEKNGWEINTEITPSVVSSKSSVNLKGLRGATTEEGQKLAIDVIVPYDGIYRIDVNGSQNKRGAALSDIYFDGIYFGDYCFSDEINSGNDNKRTKRTRTLSLSAGTHTFVFVPLVAGELSNYNQNLNEIRFANITELPEVSDVSFMDEKIVLDIGETANVCPTVKLSDGYEFYPKKAIDGEEDSFISAEYTAFDNEIISVSENGEIVAKAPGETSITISVVADGKSFEKTVYVEVQEPSEIDTTFVSAEIRAPYFVMSVENNGVQLSAVALNRDGEALPDSEVVWMNDNEEVIELTESGFVTPKAIGTAIVTAMVSVGDEEQETKAYISVREGKVERTYFFDDMVDNARENVNKYDWAKTLKEEAVAKAETYIGMGADALWNFVPGEGLPRSLSVGLYNDPTMCICRYCGKDLYGEYGNYPFVVNPLGRPWKVQCPDCKRIFPSNDFESFYELGKDDKNVFNVDLAHKRHHELVFHKGGEECTCDAPTEKYTKEWYDYYGYGVAGGFLCNDLYKEVGEVLGVPEEEISRWGVDSGWGYRTGKVHTNGVEEVHTYVAFYNHHAFWYTSAPNKNPVITTALQSLSDAYVYTGDVKYGRLGAILLDRLADLYPGYDLRAYLPDYYNMNGGSQRGKVIGSIWEPNLIELLAKSYDALFPMYDDTYVVGFLSKKADRYNLENKKTTPEMIRENIETGILRESYNATTQSLSLGNFGRHQSGLAVAAVVLDTYPDTRNMLDWIFQYGETDNHTYNNGGCVNWKIVDQVSRDGMGTETASHYNYMWAEGMSVAANAIANYAGRKGYDEILEMDLYRNPKFLQMIKVYAPLTLLRRGVPQIGDHDYAARFLFFPKDDYVMVDGFKYTGDIEIAQHLWESKNGNLDEIHYDVYTKNPERLRDEVKAIINTYGEYDYDKSVLLSDYGFAALRAGTLYDSVGTNVIRDTERFAWMYFGGSVSHSHEDMLNLGFGAYGIEMTTDLGYPEFATDTDPHRRQFLSPTISHNAVVVNEKTQDRGPAAEKPLHFDATADRVQIMDVSATPYAACDEYRRTIVMVDYDSEVSYGIDFFRVLGGEDHLYSFHVNSQKDPETSGNLSFTYQPEGSYAGADVPHGPDPDTDTNTAFVKTKYPAGYTWLYDVNRADNTGEKNFWLDYEIEDFRDYSRNGKMDMHLRLTMVNDFEADEVSYMNGTPPRRDKNFEAFEHFEYMLVRRKGRNLNTLFTTVLEPYNGKRYIKENGISRVDIARKDGTSLGLEQAAAVKIEFVDGRIDYVIYTQDNGITYTITDAPNGYSFDFKGFVGVWTVKENSAGTGFDNVYSYINDGEIIGNNNDLTSAFSGTVTDFEKDLSLDNWIEVEFSSPITQMEADELSGRMLNIDYDEPGNAAYTIESVTMESDTRAIIDIGEITTVSGYVDKEDEDKGYTYYLEEGKSFEIPMSYENNPAPVFEKTENLTASAGSSVSVQVKANSEYPLEYFARTLPRGASFNSENGTINWKPSASQIGKNLFAIDAVDVYGRNRTQYFTITVYGSTSGGAQKPTTPSEPTTPSVPTIPTTPETPAAPEYPEATTRFIDIGNHAWAADAINELAKAGIIKGTSENTFSPAANITRADFAILLVRAFKLDSKNTENFADVADSDYFAKELAVARNTGLVNGIGENKFAPRNNITRQDMMVIVYRALKSMNKLDVGDGVLDVPQAPDFDQVTDYAKKAVSALVNTGLVNGKNGKIAPTDYTTRAEVAVLIKRILDYTSK